MVQLSVKHTEVERVFSKGVSHCQVLTSVISGTSSAKTSTRSVFMVSPGANLTSPDVGLTSPTASLPSTVACHWTTTVPIVPALRTIGNVTSMELEPGSSMVTGAAWKTGEQRNGAKDRNQHGEK